MCVYVISLSQSGAYELQKNILFDNNRSNESLNQSFIGILIGTKLNLNLMACLITLTFKNENQSWKPTLIFNEDIEELLMLRN